MRFDWRFGVLKDRDYDIEIYKLANGRHQYTFEVYDSFFERFENALIEKGSAAVVVDLEKSDTLIKMVFGIEGVYELTCDRSLDKFMHPFSTTENVIFKFGDEPQELDDDIFVILKNTQRLNVAQFIYEFISITIPMKKLHPRFQNEPEGDDEILVYSSLSDEESSQEPDEKDSPPNEVDPRWLKLKNLKDKYNDN